MYERQQRAQHWVRKDGRICRLAGGTCAALNEEIQRSALLLVVVVGRGGGAHRLRQRLEFGQGGGDGGL